MSFNWMAFSFPKTDLHNLTLFFSIFIFGRNMYIIYHLFLLWIESCCLIHNMQFLHLFFRIQTITSQLDTVVIIGERICTIMII